MLGFFIPAFLVIFNYTNLKLIIMFALLVITPDYTNIKFIMHRQNAIDEYTQEVIDLKEEDVIMSYGQTIALFEITGEGYIQVGQGIGSDEGVELLYCYPENHNSEYIMP